MYEIISYLSCDVIHMKCRFHAKLTPFCQCMRCYYNWLVAFETLTATWYFEDILILNLEVFMNSVAARLDLDFFFCSCIMLNSRILRIQVVRKGTIMFKFSLQQVKVKNGLWRVLEGAGNAFRRVSKQEINFAIWIPSKKHSIVSEECWRSVHVWHGVINF